MNRRRAVAVLILGLLGVRVWWRAETERPLLGPPGEIAVPAGASTQAIAGQLFATGLIPRPWTFTLLVRLRGDGARIKAGRYRFDGPYSLLDIEQKLVQGEVERREITFTEGKNVFEMAEIAGRAGLDNAAFLAAARNPSAIVDLDPGAMTLEGYLFPETYDIRNNASVEALVAEMVSHARDVFDRLGVGAAGRSIAGVSLNLRQIVTLASIVELETAAPAERPRIAGVFLNRLRLGMKLQTDPTVIYALKLEGRYHGNIRKVDLGSESPYNTYRFGGLPPGPIGSPGLAALLAVLKPAATKDLYFVSRNDGTHVFSTTLRDHERAVDEFQRRRPAKTTKASDSPPAPSR